MANNKALDQNGLLYFGQQFLANLRSIFQAKETGKGLSTNDFTNALKDKLDGIAAGATANQGTITGINMNGTSKGTSGVVDLGTVITGHQDISGLAPKASPAFTGTPTAPTAAVGTNNTQVATTAFVKNALDNYTPSISGPLVYRGSCTYANLPNNPSVGDMWDVTDAQGDYPAGTDYAWNGTAWNPLGGKLTIEYMTNSEVTTVINTIFS